MDFDFPGSFSDALNRLQRRCAKFNRHRACPPECPFRRGLLFGFGRVGSARLARRRMCT